MPTLPYNPNPNVSQPLGAGGPNAQPSRDGMDLQKIMLQRQMEQQNQRMKQRLPMPPRQFNQQQTNRPLPMQDFYGKQEAFQNQQQQLSNNTLSQIPAYQQLQSMNSSFGSGQPSPEQMQQMQMLQNQLTSDPRFISMNQQGQLAQQQFAQQNSAAINQARQMGPQQFQQIMPQQSSPFAQNALQQSFQQQSFPQQATQNALTNASIGTGLNQPSSAINAGFGGSQGQAGGLSSLIQNQGVKNYPFS